MSLLSLDTNKLIMSLPTDTQQEGSGHLSIKQPRPSLLMAAAVTGLNHFFVASNLASKFASPPIYGIELNTIVEEKTFINVHGYEDIRINTIIAADFFVREK